MKAELALKNAEQVWSEAFSVHPQLWHPDFMGRGSKLIRRIWRANSGTV